VNELPGLAHMQTHVPSKYHDVLGALLTAMGTREIAESLHIARGDALDRRLAIVYGCLGVEAWGRSTHARLTLLRVATGLDPCWCQP